MLNKSNLCRLAFTAALAAIPIEGQVFAQTPTANNPGVTLVHFDIPAQPLSQATLQFSDQAHLQLVFDAPLANGVNSSAIQGSFTITAALNRLLAGTGLTWRFLDAHTVTIQPKTAQNMSGATVFGAVDVEGSSGIFADLTGFGAGAGVNGSSDVTATEGTGSLTTNGSSITTGRALSLRETPQSVSVITQEQIKQQKLTDLTAALNYMPGVALQTASGVTANFISRGFDVTTMHVDGGAPLWLNPTGTGFDLAPDLSEYDHIEMLQGSDALLGGEANPGGTINLVRKRPLDHAQITLEFDTGSWANERVEADLTGPFAFGGHLRGRIDVDYRNRGFFYNTAHQEHGHAYGIVEADLGADTLLRFGASFGHEIDPGYNVEGLPRYPDGSDLGLPRSTCYCAHWNKLNTNSDEIFAELDHRLSEDWDLKINTQAISTVTKAVYDNVSGPVLPTTLPTITSYGPYTNQSAFRQYAVDATLSGSFMALGYAQKIVASAQFVRYLLKSNSLGGAGGSSGIPVFGFNASMLDPAPDLPTTETGFNSMSASSGEQSGASLSVILQPMARLHLTGGFRINNLFSDLGINETFFGFPVEAGAQQGRDYGTVTPTFGVTYDILPELTAYASYSGVYQTQTGKYSADNQPMPPLTGVTQEIGLKSALLDDRLNLSLSGYSTIQNNQPILENTNLMDNGGLCCFVNAGKVHAMGINLQASGELSPGWQITAGYNYNREFYSAAFMSQTQIGKIGTTAIYLTQQPINQLKLWTSYRLPDDYKQWSVGGGVRMESARYTQGSVCSLPSDPTGNCIDGTYIPFNFTQGLYAVLDLHVGYRLDNHWNADFNVTNLTDTRYYATAGDSSSGNYYGEPRAFLLAVHALY